MHKLPEALLMFNNEKRAYSYLRRIRWGSKQHVCCPHCGFEKCYSHSSKRSQLIRRYKCFKCKRTFNDLTGTLFADSKVELWKWFYAMYEFSQRQGISAVELGSKLHLSYPTSLKMLRKIRSFLIQNNQAIKLTGIVEADEAWVNKIIIQGLVQRDGKLTVDIIDNLKEITLQRQIKEKVEAGSKVVTDQRLGYMGLLLEYKHETVNHSKEFVNTLNRAHTNTIEGAWSHLKRLLGTIYHGVWNRYLKHYLAEFVFRYNNRKCPDLFSHLACLLLSPRYCLY